MRIFIFKPSKNWGYCGGGLVITAKNFKNAGRLFNKKQEGEKSFSGDYQTIHLTEKDASNFYRPGLGGVSMWVLVKEIVVFASYNQKEEVILFDYNYA